MRVAIVGGGMAGLAAAWQIHREGGAEAVVLEEAEFFGGKLRTERPEGFVLEEAPDSFLARKEAARTLCRELGIEEEIVPLSPRGRGSAIFSGLRLHPIPPGLMYGLPTEIWPFVRSGLLSPFAKLRALLDLVIPKDPAEGDRPLGPFIGRRVGRQVVERLVEPLLSGVYAGDVSAMSTEATFPQLLELERKRRSLILGARSLRRKAPPPGEAPPAFLTLRNGLQSLPEALTAQLPQDWLRTGSEVVSLQAEGDGYRIWLRDGDSVEADAVILALPAPQAAMLLREIAPHAALALFSVSYASLAVASLAFPPEALSTNLHGSGFLVPRSAGLSITACTYVVNKWPHESKGGVLVRCYLGRANESPLGRTDEEILLGVRDDLKKVLGITAEPLISRVYRWPEGIPQYTVGHLERVRAAREGLQGHPRVRLCGAAYDGVGIPDVIRQGRDEARAILAQAVEEGKTRKS